MILITGAQRSGTKFVATVLSRAGINATHEGNPPGQDWRVHDPRLRPRTEGIDVDVCWHSAAWLGTELLKDAYVVHLVRHPLESISSSMHRNTFMKPAPSGKWAIKCIPELGKGSNIERCAKYWNLWNKIIEPHADQRVRIEDMSINILADILKQGNVDFRLGALTYAFESVPKTLNTNSGTKKKVGFANIKDPVRTQVQRRAEKYGY